jgi:hypothetical protein
MCQSSLMTDIIPIPVEETLTPYEYNWIQKCIEEAVYEKEWNEDVDDWENEINHLYTYIEVEAK